MKTRIRNVRRYTGFYIEGCPYKINTKNCANGKCSCVNLKTNKDVVFDGDDWCITSTANVDFSNDS